VESGNTFWLPSAIDNDIDTDFYLTFHKSAIKSIRRIQNMSRVVHYVKLYKYVEWNKLIPSQVHEWCLTQTGQTTV